jgi:hypothetical protein
MLGVWKFTTSTGQAIYHLRALTPTTRSPPRRLMNETQIYLDYVGMRASASRTPGAQLNTFIHYYLKHQLDAPLL